MFISLRESVGRKVVMISVNKSFLMYNNAIVAVYILFLIQRS